LNRTDNSLNFIVNDSARSVSQAYFIAVHVNTANTFLNNSITLNNNPVTFASFNASLDVSYGIDDISGSYLLVDPSANVDLSVNNVRQQRGILSPFDVSGLRLGDNSLNFTVRGYDNLSSQPYFVKVNMQNALAFKTLYLNQTLVNLNNANVRLDVSYGVSSIHGEYFLVDPSDNVDLSVNRTYYRNLSSSFDVSLNLTNNSFNFLITGSDRLSSKNYFVNVVIEASCLLEGTLVWSDRGYVPIETLQVGDSIQTQHY
jgi:hypothetical protein